MPVIPSFRSFAPTPNLAGSYNAGAALQVERQKAAMAVQMQRQQMQQAAVQAEMELNAKKEIAQMQNLRQIQEAEMQKSYQQAQLAMKEREMEDQSMRTNMMLEEAQRKLAVDTQYQALYNEGIASGKTPQEASQLSMLRINPALYGGAGTASVRGSGIDANVGKIFSPPEYPDLKILQTGPNSVRPIEIPKDLTQEKATPGPTSDTVVWNGKLVKIPDAVKNEREELKALEKKHEDDRDGGVNWAVMQKQPKKLSAQETAKAISWKKRDDRITELENIINQSRKGSPTSSTNAPAVPKFDFSGAKTNKIAGYEVIILK